jgi:hypothetical protein
MAELPRVSDAVLRSENTRTNAFLNYESPALTAELQARFRVANIQYSTSNAQFFKKRTPLQIQSLAGFLSTRFAFVSFRAKSRHLLIFEEYREIPRLRSE